MNNSDDKTTATLAEGAQSTTWQLNAITEALGELTLTVDDSLSIGRGNDNDVILGSKEVSRNHALLSVLNGQLYVKDLNSSNGTSINNERIEGNQSKPLKAEDELGFAGFSFQVMASDLASTSSMPTSTDVVQPVVTEQTESGLNNIDDAEKVTNENAEPMHDVQKSDPEVISNTFEDSDEHTELTMGMEPAIDSPVEPVVVEETVLENLLVEPVIEDTELYNEVESADDRLQQQPVVKETIINEVLSAGALSTAALSSDVDVDVDVDAEHPVLASEPNMSTDEVTGMSNVAKETVINTPLATEVEHELSADTPTSLDNLADNTDVQPPVAKAQPTPDISAEHDKTTTTALQEEADPDVLRAKQAATGQFSGTANLGQPRDLGTQGNNAMDQALTNAANTGQVEKKASGSWFIWLFIVIVIVGLAVWLFNMGGA